MKDRMAALITGAVVAAFMASPSFATPTGPTHDLVLEHTNVVNVGDGSIQRDMTVVIDAGRITAVTSDRANKPSGRQVIDVAGDFVAPGLMDMHAHPLDTLDPEGSLELMLANGITGFRQMSGSPELLQARREGRLIKVEDSPLLLAMPGSILTRLNAATPQAAVAEVDRQHDEGADFIKVIDVNPPTFFAIAAEAKRLGVTFLGHLPSTVDVRQASKAGMRSIEHLRPADSILLGCSTDEAALRASIPPPARPPGPPPSPEELQKMFRRMLVNPLLTTPPAAFPRYARVLDTFSNSKCDELAREFAANGTWQTPTLIRLRTVELASDPQYLNDPNLRYAPPASRLAWTEAVAQYKSQLGPKEQELRRVFAAQSALVRRFEDAGVPIMAGSDFGGGLEVAGFDLHQEFDLLALAGLTPLQVLQAATLNGATFLGLTKRLGGVEAGKDADLVVLGGDPNRSVQNLHKVIAVVRAGRYYSRGDLDEVLRRIRDRYAKETTQ